MDTVERPGRKQGNEVKTWVRRAGLGALIAGLASLLLFVGAIQFTNRSDFCTTCHYMQPFYDAWAASSHHNVPCRDCHYEPGYSNVVKGKMRDMNQLVKYWTNAYRKSKPWAEIADESCLRSGCHSERLLQGRVMFGRVNFDHAPHLEQMRRGKKLRCTSCHSQIVQGEHMKVTETTCITCHFKLDEQGKNNARCAICHDPPTTIAGQEPPKYDHIGVIQRKLDCVKCHGGMVVGDGVVPRERCYSCHWDRERLDKYNNTDLMHATHITEHKIECDLCHHSMQHKSTFKEQVIPDCQTCHEGFHEAQKDLFVGHGGIGVADQPNPMFEKGISCQGCHIVHTTADSAGFAGETFVASGASCESCHGTGYSRLLENWKKSAQLKVDVVGKALEEANRLRSQQAASGPNEVAEDSLLKEAHYNYSMVQKGKPIHNIIYANQLLDAAYDRLQRFFELTKPGYKLAAIGGESDVVPSNCINCHMGIEDVDAQIFGLTYSHRRHLVNAQQTCARCHSNQRRHGELIVQKRDCLSCHHSQKERECGYCHTAQQAILDGQSTDLPLSSPDVMIAAGTACRDCHERPDRAIVRPPSQRCVDCHDNSYAGRHREWLDEFATLRQTLDSLLTQATALPVTPGRDAALEPIRGHIRACDADGSRGTHNHAEQMRILQEDAGKLAALLRTTG